MAQVDSLDIIVLLLLLLGSIAYFTKGTYWGIPKDPYASSYANGSASKAGK
jgi:NADPH-ferrihemoprotein reductase